MDIEEREILFRKEVSSVGGLLYKKSVIEDFCDYWSEADRAKKPKQRWEKQKTWKTSLRLKTWAKRSEERGKNPYLSDNEKTIEQKKREFIAQLRPYQDKYSRDVLNGFYNYWCMPENAAVPKSIRWEGEAFWSLESRLAAWNKREEEKNKQKVF